MSKDTGTSDDDDVRVVPGSIQWLGEFLKTVMTATNEARHRYWHATDEVARLRRDLSAAEERLATEEREYHAAGKLMYEVWGHLRHDVDNAPPVGSVPSEVLANSDGSDSSSTG